MVEIDKDVVRRILSVHYRPESNAGGPSWLTFLGHTKDSLWSCDFRVRHPENALGSGRDGSIYPSPHWVWPPPGVVDGVALCRMLQRAIRGSALPKYPSSDHDPLYRFHQWQANLRVLAVTEIKTVPCVPLSHPFVERFIGTTRRELLDRTLFWTTADLEARLIEFQHDYTGHRTHAGLEGRLPQPSAGDSAPIDFRSYRWHRHCRGLYQTPHAA